MCAVAFLLWSRRSMPAEISLAPVRALLSALRNSQKRIAVLVGSPMSMPDAPGARGVPGVSAMIELVKARVAPEDRADYEKALAATDSAHRYQQAMAFLRDWVSQDAVNAVVRKAVRQARLHPEREGHLPDEALEEDNAGWSLPAGTSDLGALVVESPERFGPILTTNFDPLLSVAIQRAGGKFMRTSLDADGRLNLTESSEKHAAHIIHLHGFWLRTDTLHTQSQLARSRPYLAASLKELVKEHTLVVVGYGGWDDIFTQALTELDHDGKAPVDVLWAFYESDPALVRVRYESLFARIGETSGRGRFRAYGGVNCHELFKLLREEFQARTATPPPAESPKVNAAHAEGGRPSPTGPLDAPPKAAAPGVQAAHAAVPQPAQEERSSSTGQPVVRPPVTSLPQAAFAPSPRRVPHALKASVFAVSLLVVGLGLLHSTGSGEPPAAKVTAPAASPSARPLSMQGNRTSNGAGRATSPVSSPSAPITIDALRKQHRVKMAPGDGRAQLVGQLQPGTYGFMLVDSAPLLGAARLLAPPSDDGVEVHRTPDGTFFLVGYVQLASAKALSLRNPADIVLAARSQDARTELVNIPFSRLSSVDLRQDKGSKVLLIGLAPTQQ